MHQRYLPALLLLISFLNFHCASIKERPKYKLSDGLYKVRHGRKKEKAYVAIAENNLKIFSRDQLKKVDTTQFKEVNLSGPANDGSPTAYTFSKTTFDIDLLSLPAKLRFQEAGFPPQLDAGLFNGAVYLGRRIDVYRFKTKQNALGISHPELNHYGFSLGAFGGLGTTPINEYVTNKQIDIQYSGVVLPTGITSLFAVNNFTFGLAIGIDHLLDKNKKFWIYQRKPWLGLAIGFNLN